MQRQAWRRHVPNLPPEAQAGGLSPRFARLVVCWQRSYGRSKLPWQNTRDPYRVWLSEVMLQQTQVATVLAYFERFIARFPTVAELARAPEDAVFGLWSGLGYYSRARNLHRCAMEIMARFDGAFPRSAAELETLPGIGRSTAAAIAAFCFDERVAILDSNVKRVLTRVLGFGAELSTATNERKLWDAATALLPAGSGADMTAYTQGLMDLGATVCLARRPNCKMCPINPLCIARLQGAPDRYPVKTRKLRRSAQALWMLSALDPSKRVWLEKRSARGIWAGLYCLPMYESRAALLEALPASHRDLVSDDAPFVHVLTHKDLHLQPVSVQCDAGTEIAGGGQWCAGNAWAGLGLPAPVRTLLISKIQAEL